MKNYYILLSIFLLAQIQAEAQDQFFASNTVMDSQFRKSNDQISLKKSLSELEQTFNVSIAFKDEWIENKQVLRSALNQSTIEIALGEVLKNTNLDFENAGDNFFVIFQKERKTTRKSKFLKKEDSPRTTNSFSGGVRGQSFGQYRYSESVQGVEELTVRGKVTDENGEPLPGVNILIKGTSNGAVSDVSGNYSIEVPDENAILVFSFVGYSTKEIEVSGRSTIDVSLIQDVQSLEEVVVTALGIEKSSKSLGYSTTKVNPDDFAVNRSPNIMNSLQGKVAGVNISGLGTGPGGTSKIRIRGQSSISGQNNPLIVINGVPIDNTNFGTNPGNSGADGSISVRDGGGITSDGGDGLQSINPDDVESMTILKGAAAAALYGSRAKDGVIMITTRTKGDGRGIGVTYNMNYTNETPLDFTDYQYEYGQGTGGVRPTGSVGQETGQWSFGERFQPGMTQDFLGETFPYVPQRNIIRDFYRNGQNLTNTISLSSGNAKGGFNLSISNMDSKGIVPNNSFTRRTINLGFENKLTEKLSFRGNFNYSNEYNKNPPNIADQDNSIPTALNNLANSLPLDVLDRNKYDPNGDERRWSYFANRTNPYFVLAEQFNKIRRDRIFGNISMKYDILPWLFVQGRVGQDYWSRDQEYNNMPTGKETLGAHPSPFFNGRYTQESRRFRELNTDILVSANKKFGDIGLNINAGGNQMKRRSDVNSTQVVDFVIRDLYTVQNGRTKAPIYDLSERAVNSIYGAAEISYKDYLFLSGTLRNDWFSTLAPENRSILYPSVSTGFVFSDPIKMPGWISFGKLRLAYAEVGSDTDVPPYSNVLLYSINSNLFSDPSGNAQPVAVYGGATPNVIPNPNLKPMRTSEIEAGLELKLFNNRVNLDLAAYQKITSDQIVEAEVSGASGFVNSRVNSGQSRNRGFESLINIVGYESNNFTWEFTANTAYNITKVLSLNTESEGERITVATHVFDGELRQIVGEELGQLAGYGIQRDDQGRQIFRTDGLPLRTDDYVSFGSALPRWVGGFTNDFRYKEFTFSFLIDFKVGGKMISGTNFNATRHGLHKMTLVGRETGVIGVGVNELGEENTVSADPQFYYESVRSRQILEWIVYDAGFWKLRQITVGYDFSKLIPEKLPFRSVRLSVVANNVLMLKKWVPNIDPETFGYSSDNLVGLEASGIPSTRSIGFNLNVKF